MKYLSYLFVFSVIGLSVPSYAHGTTDNLHDAQLEKDFKALNRDFRVMRRTKDAEVFKQRFKGYSVQLEQMMQSKYDILDEQEFLKGMKNLQDLTSDLQVAIEANEPLPKLKKIIKKLINSRKKYHDSLGVDD